MRRRRRKRRQRPLCHAADVSHRPSSASRSPPAASGSRTGPPA